ncbi:MAG: hypothetical protein AAGC46_12655, partial [Solirubrobacteraceae bacterium]
MRVPSLTWPLASAAALFAVPALALAAAEPTAPSGAATAGASSATAPVATSPATASASANPFAFTTVGRSVVAKDGTITIVLQSAAAGKYTAFALLPGLSPDDDATAEAARVTASAASTTTAASAAATVPSTTPTRATAARAVSLLDPNAPMPLPYGDASAVTLEGQPAVLKFVPGKAGKAAIARLRGNASLRVTLDVMFGPVGGALTTNFYVVHVYRTPQAAAAAAKRSAAAKRAAAAKA